MKKYIKSFSKILLGATLVSIFLLGTAFVVVQNNFGFIDSQALVSALPDTKKVEETLKKEGTDLQNQLQEMYAEYQAKYQAYVENANLAPEAEEKWSEAVRQLKEKELMQMDENIKTFQATAQQTLDKRRAELYQPLIDKVNAAIKKVADANGIIIVFDKNSVLYLNDKVVKDLAPEVKKELGIQ